MGRWLGVKLVRVGELIHGSMAAVTHQRLTKRMFLPSLSLHPSLSPSSGLWGGSLRYAPTPKLPRWSNTPPLLALSNSLPSHGDSGVVATPLPGLLGGWGQLDFLSQSLEAHHHCRASLSGEERK